MSSPFEVGPGGGEVGPGGGEVGPATDLVIAVPAFVSTFTIPPPAPPEFRIAVPAFVSTWSSTPAAAMHANAPAFVASDSMPVPTAAMVAATPAFVATQTIPTPTIHLELRIRVPAFGSTGRIPRPTILLGGGPGGDGEHDDLIVYTPPGTGNPTYPWRLFKGQVVGVKMERQTELLVLTLDIEDYNRLPSLFPIGQPLFGAAQPDGTDILGSAPFTLGAAPTSAVMKFQFQNIWTGSGGLGISGPALDFTTMVDPDPLGGAGEIPDWSTSGSDLRSFMDRTASQAGTYVRWWITTMMELAIKKLAPVGEVSDTAMFAPWSFDEDAAPGPGLTPDMSMRPSWTFEKEVSAVLVRGGTPKSQVPISNSGGHPYAGARTYDAPGAVDYIDAFPIAQEVLAAVFRTFLSVSATVNPGHDGWRKGQTMFATSSRLSTGHEFADAHELRATPTILQSFRGRLVGGGSGITVRISADDVSDRVTLKEFSFGESISGSEKATITLEFSDPAESYHVSRLADVEIETDGTADIEYELTFGDIEPGDIAKAVAVRPKLPPYQPPVYTFSIEIGDPFMPAPPGNVVSEEEPALFYVCQVRAQARDKDGKPVGLPGLRLEWVLLTWADDARTIPGNDDSSFGYHLDDSVGITDSTGRAFTSLWRGRDPGVNPPVAYEIRAVALPV